MSPLLELVDIKLEMLGKTILDGISFRVNSGDIVGLMGSSGSGKTSTFRIINLLQSPTKGTVFYQNKDTREYLPTTLRREVGYVFQKTYLFGNTVMDNLMYPYHLLKQQPNFQEITDYLNQVNLPESIITKKINEISGGEQQRIALIRSLLVKPKILLLDEITASLDEENTIIIENLIQNQNQNRNVTVLFISHNMGQAKRLAKNILYLKNGKVSYHGSKDEYFAQKELQQ